MERAGRSTSGRVLRYLLAAALSLMLVGVAAFYGVVMWPLRDPHPKTVPAKGTLLLTGMRVYTSPDAPVLEHADVLVRDGRIVAVGLESMLTSRGFTTVVDTGSNLRDTVPLRRRIESGELAGPKIYTAGAAQYPPNGMPYYLRDTLPAWLLRFLPQPATPTEAADVKRRNIRDGADLLKLFTGSHVARGTVLPMPVENARAAVAVAHAAEQPAFAHESNAQGIRVALASGVDVLAHAADSTEGVDEALLRELITHHLAMIPTLKMFGTTVTTAPAYWGPIYAEVRRFHELGGVLVFGTDVGYRKDSDTGGEFEALTRCGLSGRDILRMLGPAPASKFPEAGIRGTIEIGQAADLTVLGGDPIADPRGFADVRVTIRNGQVIWRRPQ